MAGIASMGAVFSLVSVVLFLQCFQCYRYRSTVVLPPPAGKTRGWFCQVGNGSLPYSSLPSLQNYARWGVTLLSTVPTEAVVPFALLKEGIDSGLV